MNACMREKCNEGRKTCPCPDACEQPDTPLFTTGDAFAWMDLVLSLAVAAFLACIVIFSGSYVASLLRWAVSQS